MEGDEYVERVCTAVDGCHKKVLHLKLNLGGVPVHFCTNCEQDLINQKPKGQTTSNGLPTVASLSYD